MSKQLFEVLHEMNQEDAKNNTATVGVCNGFLGGTLTRCYNNDVIPILLLIDRKEYEKRSK